MENKTHWKKAFKSDYLSSSDVDGKDLQLTIAKVVYQECLTQSGRKFCNVAYFTDTRMDNKGKCIGGTKPMILNVTNSKTVKRFANNATHLEDWKNINISVYVDGNVNFGKETVEGLRIRPNKPKNIVGTVALTKELYPKAVNFLRGGRSISDLKKLYTFNEAIEARLIADSKPKEENNEPKV